MILSVFAIMVALGLILIFFGYYIGSKVIIYAGATILMMTGFTVYMPQGETYGGQLEVMTGHNDTTLAAVTIRQNIYTELPEAYQNIIAFIITSVGLYFLVAVWFDKRTQ